MFKETPPGETQYETLESWCAGIEAHNSTYVSVKR